MSKNQWFEDNHYEVKITAMNSVHRGKLGVTTHYREYANNKFEYKGYVMGFTKQTFELKEFHDFDWIEGDDE